MSTTWSCSDHGNLADALLFCCARYHDGPVSAPSRARHPPLIPDGPGAGVSKSATEDTHAVDRQVLAA
jgi:hypothetical protein